MRKALAVGSRRSKSNPEPSQNRKPRRQVGGQLGPYSKVLERGALGRVNGWSWEGRFLRAYEDMLIKHVGGNPNAIVRQLITRACRLALYVEIMDKRCLANGGDMTEHDRNYYLAWENALRRTLQAIGVKEPVQSSAPQTLDDYLAKKSRRRTTDTNEAAA